MRRLKEPSDCALKSDAPGKSYRILRAAPRFLSLLLLCALSARPGGGQASFNSVQQIEEFLQQFSNSDSQARAAAFYGLLGLGGALQGQTMRIPAALETLFKEHPDRTDRIKVALIGLLERELNRKWPASKRQQE